jgi:hypothetical protein
LSRADALSDVGVKVAVFVLLPVDALVDGVVLAGVPVMVLLFPAADDPAGATATGVPVVLLFPVAVAPLGATMAGVPVMVFWLPIADARTAVGDAAAGVPVMVL